MKIKHAMKCHYPLSQFSSVTQSCPTLCDPMDCSMLGFPVHHQLPGLTQTHVHWVGDVIQPSHLLLSPPPPAFSLSQHQGLFQRVSSSHQVVKVLEFQLQHQSFQWIFRTDFLQDWQVGSIRKWEMTVYLDLSNFKGHASSSPSYLHSLIHSISTYLLSAYCVPGTVRGMG